MAEGVHLIGIAARDRPHATRILSAWESTSKDIRVESGGAFFSAELLIKLQARGRTVVEVPIPHYPRTAGSATGAKPSVVFRAVRDFWLLRLRMWAVPRSAFVRGEPMTAE